MPTFFGRRYMRAELKGTHEVFIGIFVLVLTGSLCAALMVHSQGEAPKLFEIAPERRRRICFLVAAGISTKR